MMIEESSYTCLHRSVIRTFLKMERGGINSLPIYLWLVGRWESENGNLDQMAETPSRISVAEPSIEDFIAVTGRTEDTTRRYIKFLTDYDLVVSGPNSTLSIAVYMGGVDE
ncbi:hypothetical protein [Rahnella sp. ChDrAdgB13]|uniref:hypothetical protein n=1 Tax=Rahnella sp. ChDrAdgB13 TaxID=1850581 RepID=UPI001AD86D4A|nr:hypothetical protein [Rahnella sp. ChDrAdgB13]